MCLILLNRVAGLQYNTVFSLTEITTKGPIHADTGGDTCITIQYRYADFNLCGNVSRNMF